MLKITSVFFVLPLLLVGCQDEKKHPTKETFTKLLKNEIDQEPNKYKVCSSIRSPMLKDVVDYKTSARQEEFFKKYEILQRLGYLTIENKPEDQSHYESYIQVRTNDKYNKDFGAPQSDADFLGGISSKLIDICYGHYKFREVSDFTQPSDTNGMIISQVDYTVTPVLDSDKSWIKNKELIDTIGLNIINSDQKRQVVTVLKDSGWTLQP